MNTKLFNTRLFAMFAMCLTIFWIGYEVSQSKSYIETGGISPDMVEVDPVMIPELRTAAFGYTEQYAPFGHYPNLEVASPGDVIRYDVVVNNYEREDRDYRLEIPLPDNVAYVDDSADGGLEYDAGNHTMIWAGSLEPGRLDYRITDAPFEVPYVNLADYGKSSLCLNFVTERTVEIATTEPVDADDDGEQDVDEEGNPITTEVVVEEFRYDVNCDRVTIDMNLGKTNHYYSLFGEKMTKLTITPNGLIYGNGNADINLDFPQSVPDSNSTNAVIAPLWRDNNMSQYDMRSLDEYSMGGWYAAIIPSWIDGKDVFYVQWHNANDEYDPNLATVRHAVALVLDDSGDMYYIYDNIAQPSMLMNGYTIGVEDTAGIRGTLFATAGELLQFENHPPIGNPPESGDTFYVRPIVYGNDNVFHNEMSYELEVVGPAPDTLLNTAYLYNDNTADSSLDFLFATAYTQLNDRYESYLPLVYSGGGGDDDEE